jgi:hypothetical protein
MRASPSVQRTTTFMRALVARPAQHAASAVFALAYVLSSGVASAQNDPMRPGEAFVTRFSGVTPGPGSVLNQQGTVGSIIDIRTPGQPPVGQHWIDEPQRSPLTAAEVGQVFGVALDDGKPPNIYIAATSAFGLHRAGAGWMPGMWGTGGPGAIYRLEAASGYRPRLFATVSFQGRQNSGPALGNIAFDRWNKQLYVSDLETGMIHRISLDGRDLGTFDHGAEGRTSFVDGQTSQPASLPAIPYSPAVQSGLPGCASKNFESSPECWGFATSGRRVWGLGITRLATQEVRLFYSVWSSPAFGQDAAWRQASEDDKRNAVWSVRILPDGSFDRSGVRREFMLPDFFTEPKDVARAGYSHPASDIAFPVCSTRPVMLVAERGGVRNLGRSVENAFATPHEARTLRYELNEGQWQPIGRYDIGFYDRSAEGPPFMRANCAGGAAFGPDYGPNGEAQLAKPDEYVWMTGDSLCSPKGRCNLAGLQNQQAGQGGSQQANVQSASAEGASNGQGEDDSEVHGTQGLAENLFDEVAPAAAFAPTREPDASAGPNQSYLIDTDINVDAQGNLIEAELTRNDATRIGDIVIYQECEVPAAQYALMPAMPRAAPRMWGGMSGGGGQVVEEMRFAHPPDASHARLASHGREMSHFRFGSHALELSHNRFASHVPYYSHRRFGSHSRFFSHNRSGSHDLQYSHQTRGSHSRVMSHFREGSHDLRRSHHRWGSHNQWISHRREGSHNARLSHARTGSHLPRLSHSRDGSHTSASSHGRDGSHNQSLSHSRIGSHARAISQGHDPAVSHRATGSHNRIISDRGTHGSVLSHRRVGSHNPAISQTGTHNRVASRGPVHSRVASRGPVHNRVLSRGPVHSRVASRGPVHNRVLSRGPVHSRVASRGPVHNRVLSRGPVHSRIASRGPVHNRVLSRGPVHSRIASRGPVHNRAISRGPVHNRIMSRGPVHNRVISRGPVHRAAISHGQLRARVTVRPPRSQMTPGRFTPHNVRRAPAYQRRPGQFSPYRQF